MTKKGIVEEARGADTPEKRGIVLEKLRGYQDASTRTLNKVKRILKAKEGK